MLAQTLLKSRGYINPPLRNAQPRSFRQRPADVEHADAAGAALAAAYREMVRAVIAQTDWRAYRAAVAAGRDHYAVSELVDWSPREAMRPAVEQAVVTLIVRLFADRSSERFIEPRLLDLLTELEWWLDPVEVELLIEEFMLAAQTRSEEAMLAALAHGRALGLDVDALVIGSAMSVGLDRRYARTVMNRLSGLEPGDYAVLSAVMSSVARQLPEVVATRLASDFAVSTMGGLKLHYWEAEIDAGMLAPGTIRTWVAHIDDRTCLTCLSLDGMEAPVERPFETEYGEFWYPPAHGFCRCDMELRNDR